MLKPIEKLNDAFFKNVSKTDFIKIKSGVFTFWILNFFIVIMTVLFIFLIVSGNKEVIIYTVPSIILVALICLFLLRKGKIAVAINILALGSCAVASLGFMTKPPALVASVWTQFFHLDLVFAALFASSAVAYFCYGSAMVIHLAFFFLKVLPQTDPLTREIALRTAIFGLFVLSMVFVVAKFSKRFLNQALAKAQDESVKNLNNFQKVTELMGTIHNVTQNVEHTVDINNDVVESLSASSQMQAATAEELSSTIEEISAGVENVTQEADNQNELMKNLHKILISLSDSVDSVDNANRDLDNLFKEFLKEARDGKEASGKLNLMGSQISENSEQMKMVTAVIEDFFDRINLLSLNANIEAARAGEHGRGFAVVADEIGKLADSSAQELKQITTLIKKNQDDVTEGKKSIVHLVQFLEDLLKTFDLIHQKSESSLLEVNKQKNMKDSMKQQADLVIEKANFISTAMNEQNIAVNDIVQSVEQTNNIIQENAENTETLHQNAQELKAMMDNLTQYFD